MPTDTLIPITVNGDPHAVPPGLALPDLLRRLDLDPERPGIAVALDGAVVRRTEWAETIVGENAEVEVITATQGG